jgi:hypothetical protein
MPVQPGDRPGQPPLPGRPAMRTGTGIFLIAAGAVLLFALRSGSPHWLNLQIVGVILILVGGLGMLLSRLARSRRGGDWLRPASPKASASPPSEQTKEPAARRRKPPTTAPPRWPTTSSATSRTTKASTRGSVPILLRPEAGQAGTAARRANRSALR